MVGAYSACAEFIKLSKTKFPGNTIFCNISFVGTESLRDALGGYGKDVVISQVVPYPKDMSLPLIRQYVADIKMYQHDAPITFTTLEGYVITSYSIHYTKLYDEKRNYGLPELDLSTRYHFRLSGNSRLTCHISGSSRCSRRKDRQDQKGL